LFEFGLKLFLGLKSFLSTHSVLTLEYPSPPGLLRVTTDSVNAEMNKYQSIGERERNLSPMQFMDSRKLLLLFIKQFTSLGILLL